MILFESVMNLILTVFANIVAVIHIICVYTVYFTSGVQVLPKCIKSLPKVSELIYEI